MATSVDNKLRRLLQASPLFSNLDEAFDESKGIDLSKISEDRAVTLARINKADTKARGIRGSKSKLESKIIDTAGEMVGELPEIVVANVQRNKKFKRDQRSYGGISSLEKTRLREQPQEFVPPEEEDLPPLPETPAPTGSSASTPAAGLNIGIAGMQGMLQNVGRARAGQIAGDRLDTGSGGNVAAGLTTGNISPEYNPVQRGIEEMVWPGEEAIPENLPSFATDTLQQMGAGNTAMTGGQVGGAPSGALQAAESQYLSGQSAASTMLSQAPMQTAQSFSNAISGGAGAMSTQTAVGLAPTGLLANIAHYGLPALGFGLQAYNILKLGLGPKGPAGAYDWKNIYREYDAKLGGKEPYVNTQYGRLPVYEGRYLALPTGKVIDMADSSQRRANLTGQRQIESLGLNTREAQIRRAESRGNTKLANELRGESTSNPWK